IGRLKLGPFAVGAAKNVLAISLAYSKQRKAFGHEIASFGVIRHKLAEMAIRSYAAESVAFRVEGLISEHLEGFSWNEPAAARRMIKAVEEFAAEKAHRDSRINRIFEGTNEINRLLVTGMLLKRAQQGRLGLVKAAKALMDEILAGPSLTTDSTPEEHRLVRNAKKIALLLLGSAFEKFGAAMEEQQEVLSGIADVVME